MPAARRRKDRRSRDSAVRTAETKRRPHDDDAQNDRATLFSAVPAEATLSYASTEARLGMQQPWPASEEGQEPAFVTIGGAR